MAIVKYQSTSGWTQSCTRCKKVDSFSTEQLTVPGTSPTKEDLDLALQKKFRIFEETHSMCKRKALGGAKAWQRKA